jgi:hypothetical protein
MVNRVKCLSFRNEELKWIFVARNRVFVKVVGGCIDGIILYLSDSDMVELESLFLRCLVRR